MHLKPRYETSAGGLAVRTIDGELAAVLIGRTGRGRKLRWSMPKGHVEAGETLEQTAMREVEEETGIIAHVTGFLGISSYSFNSGPRRIHKKVHHFLLAATGGELSDADIEVTEVAWVPLRNINERLAFAAERRLVRKARRILGVP